MKTKTLTVSSLYRLAGSDWRPCHERVPAVRLTGKWLTGIGFIKGAKITCRYENGTLILQPVNA
jgi:hypothetical protein